MKEFILGVPKTKVTTRENITTFTVYQDAASACTHCVGIFREDLDKAKERFLELAVNN